MESTPFPIIEIADLALAPPDSSKPYGTNRLTVTQGDVIAIVADAPIDGRYLLRILATLAQPARGIYRFKGESVNPKDYRRCLAIKRQIGYVAVDAAMISNRTLRENLLLARFYYENDLTIDIDQTAAWLCEDAGLFRKLNQRPSVLSDSELLKAITIREMVKSPAVMLVDRPENFLEIVEDNGIFSHLKRMVQSGTAVVFFSHNRKMIDLSNRRMTMVGGEIRTQSV
jgi:ABC-type lipoprotein export system ATPase subunit